MRKMGARSTALLFVTAAALVGVVHVAPSIAYLGGGAAHHGGAAPRMAGHPPSATNGPRGGLRTGTTGVHPSAVSIRRFPDRKPAASVSRHKSSARLAGHAPSRSTLHGKRLVGRSSAGSFRDPGRTAAGTVRGRKSVALANNVRGHVPKLRDRFAGAAYLRPRYHGGFTGWSGPLFWPYAYDDIFDYTFWPYDFDQTFWAYAYADVYNSIVWPYGGSAGSIGVPGGPPRLTRSRTGVATGQSQDIAQLCGGRTPGLTDWPIERIEQTVAPTQGQQAALLELKNASAKAIEVLHAACPIGEVATPLARLDAMEKRLDAMRQAVALVRPALESFYGSLHDEQKVRFNAIGYASNAPHRETSAGREAEGRSHATDFCSSNHAAVLSDRSIRRIERAVHPIESQRGALDALREASAKAIETLRSACPRGIPATPLARLDILNKRLETMAQAVKTIRPSMQHFYDLLGDEQKAYFNAIGLRENGVGSREAISGERR
jgi:hypothetical protein